MLAVTLCSFTVLVVEIKEKFKSSQRTKRAENLHSHTP